jgi:hypothetical protein
MLATIIERAARLKHQDTKTRHEGTKTRRAGTTTGARRPRAKTRT